MNQVIDVTHRQKFSIKILSLFLSLPNIINLTAYFYFV
ncbi:hypothetical protein BOVAB4_1217 [Bacteroides ovatus]|nr:hypothetical protein BOVAB4_1217 [Bacteroides ovatus]